MSGGFVALIVIIAIAAMVGFALIAIYNKLVSFKQQTEEGWSGIDVALKKRADLIPNLLATVKGYMTHERELLENITEARARAQRAEAKGSSEDRVAAEADMSAGLLRLFAVAENYPDLKANQNFIQLQNSLEEIEAHIQMARRYYNGTVRNLNTLIGQFPSNIVAGLFGFHPANYFEVEDAQDRVLPEVKF